MDEKIKSELMRGKESPFVRTLLAHAKKLVEMSRSTMQGYYDYWDDNDLIYRGERSLDSEDRKARLKGQPEKMVVPLAFAQVQTFVSFCLTLFLQRENIVELQPQEPGDVLGARVGEVLIARDLKKSKFPLKLKQFLLDIARFSVGVFKHTWVVETKEMPGELMPGSDLLRTASVQVPVFEGNRVEVVSPYRFFPDPRVPLSRFQEGEFCASEDEITIMELKKLEKIGLYAGVSQITPWSKETLTERARVSRLFSSLQGKPSVEKSPGVCVLTEVQVWLVPNKFILEDGTALGKEDFPVLYVITYANDTTVIRVEPMNYVHNQFTYDVAEYDADQHHLVNVSLSSIIDRLQDTISWFINSHVTSVRRVVQNKFVIDPSGLEIEDLKQDLPYVRLNMAGAGGDVNRYLKQLQVQDVTQAHVQDAELLHQLMMTATGITENSLGQYSSGRRSATEARNVQFNASSRLKTVAQGIYYSALEPLFDKMLSNLRDGLDTETYVRVFGVGADEASYQSFKVTKDQLMGNYDFLVFDATLPSEKGYLAQQLGELLQVMMGSPESVSLFGYDPSKILDKMFELRGVKNLQSLKYSPEQLAQIHAQMGATNAGGTAAGAGGVGGQPSLARLEAVA